MASVKNWIFVVIFITMVSFGTAYFLQEQAVTYGVTDMDTSYNGTFDNIAEVNNATEIVREKIQTSEIVSVEGVTALFNGAYSILRLVMSIVFLPINIMVSIGTYLGFPWWASAMITAAIIISVGFAIANVVFGRQST